LLLGFLGWLTFKTIRPPEKNRNAASRSANRSGVEQQSTIPEPTWRRRFGASASQSPETIVAAKLSVFARKRLEWIRRKSLREGKDVPRQVEEFFEALQRGDWSEIDERFSALSKRSARYDGSEHSADLDPFWPAVLEAFGAAEQVHLWPAEKLLEYGETVLGSLRPGMVYVGGTDAGRFIPTLLNETGEGEQHVVLTQNALADSRYLDYARSLFGDRLTLPTDDDSQKIFDEYVADARKRLDHDQQLPNEPPQIKPGELVEIQDGKTLVSGQVAVMAINEQLLQWILDQNPDATFAVEESSPLPSTYKAAIPLGPIMEIRAAETFDQPHATATSAYWREVAQHLADSPASEAAADLKAYSHLAVSQAHLLASHDFVEEADATYRLAAEIFPLNEAALGYASFLARSGRLDEAQKIISNFRAKAADQSRGDQPESH
jgi:hypothetical protein